MTSESGRAWGAVLLAFVVAGLSVSVFWGLAFLFDNALAAALVVAPTCALASYVVARRRGLGGRSSIQIVVTALMLAAGIWIVTVFAFLSYVESL
jgi:hypothetical protein